MLTNSTLYYAVLIPQMQFFVKYFLLAVTTRLPAGGQVRVKPVECA